MKTTRSARQVMKIQLIVVCLLFIGISGVTFNAGALLGKQSARTAASENGNTNMPKVDLGMLVAVN
jgi:hypothetical protein